MENSPSPKRRRARKSDGQFEGGNENAWEPTEVTEALPKKSYIQPAKVDGTSGGTAGKYTKKAKVSRPGIGKAHTKYN